VASILSWSVRNRLLVLALALGLAVFGALELRTAPVNVLPEFSPPYAEVQTEALGLSAEEVEQLITVPLEADLLNGVEGVKVLRSQSLAGLSSIVMVFEPGSDIYRERQLVEERLTQAHALPHVSKPPTLLQPLSSSSRVLMIGLSSKELSGIEQSVIAHWVMRPKLIGIPGVANVSVWGMRDQQLQVLVDPERLRQQGVTLSQVVESSGNAQVVSPLTFLEASTPGTGGFVESPQQRLQVRHLIEKIADPKALGGVPVAGTGGRLRLSDVADIVVDHQPLIGDAIVQGGPGLMLVVEKFPGADTRQVSEGLEDALEDLQPGLAGIQSDTTVFRPVDYLDRAMDNLALALLLGAVLALLVLVACRFRWRSILVAVVTVPLSLLVAALVLDALGQGFNAIVFAGLAAAVTVIVDEAVVATDQVTLSWRQQRTTEMRPPPTLVATALAEVRRPLTYATLVVLLVTVPVAVMEGVAGAFFGPVVLAYVAGVLAAMAVSLTVTPALTSLLNARWQPKPTVGTYSRLRTAYQRTLERFGASRLAIVGATGTCVLIALAVVPFTRISPVPAFEDPNILVELEADPGTSEVRMTALATQLSTTLAAIPGVDGVGAHVGRAVSGDRVTNVNSASVWVKIDEDAEYDDTVEDVEAAARAVPGVDHDVVTYTSKRIRDVGALDSKDTPAMGDRLDVFAATDRPIAVRVFGEDLTVLREQADRVREEIAGVDGVVDPLTELSAVEPTIEIEVDLDKAQAVGLTPGHVRRAEATLLQGIQVGSVFEQQKVFDVVVRGTPSVRGSVEDVRNMLIDTPEGRHVRLDQVADVRVVPTPSVIEREAVSRYVDVLARVEGRSATAAAADVEERLTRLSFPLEYHAEVVTRGAGEEVAWTRVMSVALAVAIAVLLLLQALFRSWRVAAIVMLTTPLSLVGGLLTGLIDGAEVLLGSMLGFMAVFGLATRVNLVLVARLRSVEAERPRLGRHETVLQVARERVVPVITTAATLAGLMVPFVTLVSGPGVEILRPMALVILGGLVSSTLVALFVLPALYLHLAPAVPQDGVRMSAQDEQERAGFGTDHGDGSVRQRSEPDRNAVS
jgi:Cu/Ag efflux pump CusA